MTPAIERREFLKQAVGIAMPAILPAAVLGRDGKVAPSNRIVVGAIGIGPRGRVVLDAFLKQPDIQFVAVCDVQKANRRAAKMIIDRRYQNEDCWIGRDLFELLARDDLDAVLIATGDRWHAVASMLAAKAGKDVYCEKPCGISLAEVQELADTMNRYERVFQAGTQRRNVANFQQAVQLARSGRLGRLHTLHASINQMEERHDWLPAEPEPNPEDVDWDRWLGPAPWRPYNVEYVRGRWRGHHDFESGAHLLDWGVHSVDLCQWAHDSEHTTPVEFEAEGNSVHARYADGVKLELRIGGWNGEGKWLGLGVCPVRFEGDQGWVEAGDSGKIIAEPASLMTGLPLDGMDGQDPQRHVRQFVDCVKSRGWTAANAAVTRRSHVACHAAATAWLLGRKLQFDPATESFVNDDQANRMRSRARRAPWHA